LICETTHLPKIFAVRCHNKAALIADSERESDEKISQIVSFITANGAYYSSPPMARYGGPLVEEVKGRLRGIKDERPKTDKDTKSAIAKTKDRKMI
jgi:hypothetical protein